MGKSKYITNVESLFKNSPVVSYSSIERIIKKRKKIKEYTKQLIRNLILKGKIRRLTKGCYTSYDDPSLIVFCFKPSYFGLQDAISFHNLWEQEAIPIIITTRKIRSGLRKILGMNVLIRRINKKYFFGFDYYQNDKFYLPYSDMEKTFIDMIYFKEKLSKETIKNIIKKIDKKKLNYYLSIYPRRIKKIVLGYFKNTNI